MNADKLQPCEDDGFRVTTRREHGEGRESRKRDVDSNHDTAESNGYFRDRGSWQECRICVELVAHREQSRARGQTRRRRRKAGQSSGAADPPGGILKLLRELGDGIDGVDDGFSGARDSFRAAFVRAGASYGRTCGGGLGRGGCGRDEGPAHAGKGLDDNDLGRVARRLVIDGHRLWFSLRYDWDGFRDSGGEGTDRRSDDDERIYHFAVGFGAS